MKPLWFDFPTESETFEIQDEHLVGECQKRSVLLCMVIRCRTVVFQVLPFSCIQSSTPACRACKSTSQERTRCVLCQLLNHFPFNYKNQSKVTCRPARSVSFSPVQKQFVKFIFVCCNYFSFPRKVCSIKLRVAWVLMTELHSCKVINLKYLNSMSLPHCNFQT